jgi:hypothetical protein
LFSQDTRVILRAEQLKAVGIDRHCLANGFRLLRHPRCFIALASHKKLCKLATKKTRTLVCLAGMKCLWRTVFCARSVSNCAAIWRLCCLAAYSFWHFSAVSTRRRRTKCAPTTPGCGGAGVKKHVAIVLRLGRRVMLIYGMNS